MPTNADGVQSLKRQECVAEGVAGGRRRANSRCLPSSRRREETAATRSSFNTAKVMEGNPVALRMKELETLECVAERIDKISVFGGLDRALNGLIKLQ